MSETMKQEAVKRALALLTVAEATYTVRLKDGTVLSTMQQPKRRQLLNNFARDYSYVDHVRKAVAGDMLEWPVPSEKHSDFLQCLRSTLTRYWGRHNYILETGPNIVKVMRA